MDIRFLLLCICLHLSRYMALCKNKIRNFPSNFKFGASSSAYQIEGAWAEDGKGMSIWDAAIHANPSLIADKSNADEAADSYHQYKRDVAMMKELGLDFYRFSISWTRILPSGFSNRINEAGLTYYSNLIDQMLQLGVKPFATIYNMDLPNDLQKIGGWTNPVTIGLFRYYAKVLFEKLGDRVKHWITVDDPLSVCVGGYGTDNKAPFLNLSGIAEYMCSKNILLAHATVYHLYDRQYRSKQNGTIGISVNHLWVEPASDTIDDYQAAIDARQFEWGQYDHPIFSKMGDFPNEMKHNIAAKSAEQGFRKSRLPEFSATEVTMLKGSADFLGVNTFTTKLAYRDASLEGMYAVPSFRDDISAVLVKDPSWPQSENPAIQDVAWGLTKLLLEIKTLYDNPPVYITANGWPTAGGLLDESRISYLRNYLNALLDAVDEDCDVRGYFVWSLMDGFEWEMGYSQKFGLYQVDFDASNKPRTPRKSAFVYKEIIRSKFIDFAYEPQQFIVETKETEE